MPLNRQFSGAIEVGRERSDSTPFLARMFSCCEDEQSATMVAKLAIWINVVQFLIDMAASAIAGAETTVTRFHGSVDTIPSETLTLLKWYHWQVLMAMSVVVYLNASAIYHLWSKALTKERSHSFGTTRAGETERYTKAARVVVALNATTLWRVLDLAIGAYFFFILDELTPSTLAESSPIDLPLLILDFMDVPLLALSVWALYTMEQQVSLTPAPMLY